MSCVYYWPGSLLRTRLQRVPVCRTYYIGDTLLVAPGKIASKGQDVAARDLNCAVHRQGNWVPKLAGIKCLFHFRTRHAYMRIVHLYDPAQEARLAEDLKSER